MVLDSSVNGGLSPQKTSVSVILYLTDLEEVLASMVWCGLVGLPKINREGDWKQSPCASSRIVWRFRQDRFLPVWHR